MRYGGADALSLPSSWMPWPIEPAHALLEIEKVWPADSWPLWVPAYVFSDSELERIFF